MNKCKGHTYERSAVELWLALHSTSPLTNSELPDRTLVPNHALRGAIAEFLERLNAPVGSRGRDGEGSGGVNSCEKAGVDIDESEDATPSEEGTEDFHDELISRHQAAISAVIAGFGVVG